MAFGMLLLNHSSFGQKTSTQYPKHSFRVCLHPLLLDKQQPHLTPTFCIHENGLPSNVYLYACPYGYNGTPSYIDSLDLSDISDLEDHFLTTSDDEDLPGLEEVPY